MDKIDDLRAELKAMERIAKILHELPSVDSLVRVANWIKDVTRPDLWEPGDSPQGKRVKLVDAPPVPPPVTGEMLAATTQLGRDPEDPDRAVAAKPVYASPK